MSWERVHVSMMTHCGAAKQHPRYNVKDNSEGINGLRELEVGAFHGQEDYTELKIARVTLWDGFNQIGGRASVV